MFMVNGKNDKWKIVIEDNFTILIYQREINKINNAFQLTFPLVLSKPHGKCIK